MLLATVSVVSGTVVVSAGAVVVGASDVEVVPVGAVVDVEDASDTAVGVEVGGGLGWRSGRTPPAAAATPASDSTAAPASRPSFSGRMREVMGAGSWLSSAMTAAAMAPTTASSPSSSSARAGDLRIAKISSIVRGWSSPDSVISSTSSLPRPSALHQHRRHPTDQVAKSVEASVHEHSHGALAAAHHLGHLADVHSRHDPQEHRVGLIGGQPAHQRQRGGQVVAGFEPSAGTAASGGASVSSSGRRSRRRSSSCRRRRAMVNSQRRKSSGPPAKLRRLRPASSQV